MRRHEDGITRLHPSSTVPVVVVEGKAGLSDVSAIEILSGVLSKSSGHATARDGDGSGITRVSLPPLNDDDLPSAFPCSSSVDKFAGTLTASHVLDTFPFPGVRNPRHFKPSHPSNLTRSSSRAPSQQSRLALPHAVISQALQKTSG